MIDENLEAPCGLYCGSCEFLGEKCDGCGQIEGKPFWTAEFDMEVCPLYGCCVNDRHLMHCGLCDDLPCRLFMEFHDPALSPEEADASVRKRQEQLLKRRRLDTDTRRRD